MKKVLVVDDNTINLKMAERVLKDVCQPILVPSGELALRFFQHNEADLILLDVLMPEMDGFETLEKLRENSASAQVPVIFLTADTDEETEQRGRETGAVNFVTKPFKKDDLLAAIEPYL